MLQLSLRKMTSIALVLVAATTMSTYAHAQVPQLCHRRLLVELTPDVPDSRDPGFLSSLLNNHPEYYLNLVRQDDSTEIVLDLIGPGSLDDCAAVVDTMRKDGRVESVHVESDEEMPS